MVHVWLNTELDMFTTLEPVMYAPVFTTSAGRAGTRGRTTWYALTAESWAWVRRTLQAARQATEAGTFDRSVLRGLEERYAALAAIADMTLDPAAVEAAIVAKVTLPVVPDECLVPFP